MTELTHEQIRDLLPDYIHASVDPALRPSIEAHLHGCAECAYEMRVIRMVADAPSFAPMIDAVKVSSAILPYGGVPVAPARPRARFWQMAVAAGVLVAVVTFVSRHDQSPKSIIGGAKQVASSPVAPVNGVASAPASVDSTPATVKTAPAPKPAGELQVAIGLEGLSDKGVAQLSRELDGFDGLPSAEPENLGVSDPNAGNEGGE